MGKIEIEIDKISARIDKIWTKVHLTLCMLRNSNEYKEESLTETTESLENKINKLDRKIEKSVEKVLALYQPLGHDFRFVMAALQINILLERTGNHANMLCTDLKKTGNSDFKISENVADLLEETIALYQNSSDVFNEPDAAISRGLIEDGINLENKLDLLKAELLQSQSGKSAILAYNLISSLAIFVQNAILVNAQIIYIIESKHIKHKTNFIEKDEDSNDSENDSTDVEI